MYPCVFDIFMVGYRVWAQVFFGDGFAGHQSSVTKNLHYLYVKPLKANVGVSTMGSPFPM